MDEFTPRIIGFHCNEKEKIEEFENGNYRSLNSVEDGIWLGDGIYFWDNNSNAAYWKKQKERKYSSKDFAITKSLLSLERLLDLSDLDDIDFCLDLIKHLKTIGIEGFSENQVGKNINILFNKSNLFKEYHILKTLGLYNKELKLNFFKINKKIPYPTTRVKTIYCVKCEEAIQKVIK